MKRVHILVSGLVQGVFYRYNTQQVALKLNLKGFVRNLSNGDVEIIAEGEEDKINELIKWCYKGPEGARVDNVNFKYLEFKNEFKTFKIEDTV